MPLDAAGSDGISACCAIESPYVRSWKARCVSECSGKRSSKGLGLRWRALPGGVCVWVGALAVGNLCANMGDQEGIEGRDDRGDC